MGELLKENVQNAGSCDMVQIVKQIVSIDFTQKKSRMVLPGAAQVYGRATPQKATEMGRFKNAACTSMHVVADLFTAMPEKLGKTRGQPQPPSPAPWERLGGGVV